MLLADSVPFFAEKRNLGLSERSFVFLKYEVNCLNYDLFCSSQCINRLHHQSNRDFQSHQGNDLFWGEFTIDS